MRRVIVIFAGLTDASAAVVRGVSNGACCGREGDGSAGDFQERGHLKDSYPWMWNVSELPSKRDCSSQQIGRSMCGAFRKGTKSARRAYAKFRTDAAPTKTTAGTSPSR